MLANRRHWLCDENKKQLGNNCYPAAADDVIGYLTKEKCESECLGGASLVELRDIIRASGIKYPFNDMLDEVVDNDEAAAAFMKSINDDTRWFVSYFINNFEDRDAFYAMLTGGNVKVFKYTIILHLIRPIDMWKIYKAMENIRGEIRALQAKRTRILQSKLSNPFARITPAELVKQLDETIKEKEKLFADFSKIAVRVQKLSEKISDKNYIQVTDTIRRLLDVSAPQYMQVEEAADNEAEIAQLIQSGRPVVLYLLLGFTDGDSHATSIVIDPNTVGGPTAFYVEPHVQALWSDEMEKIISSTFSDLFRRIGVKYTSMWAMNCPIGLQNNDHDWGSCSSWNSLVVSTCLLNPHKTKSAVLKVLLSLREHVYQLLHLYNFYVARLSAMTTQNKIENTNGFFRLKNGFNEGILLATERYSHLKKYINMLAINITWQTVFENNGVESAIMAIVGEIDAGRMFSVPFMDESIFIDTEYYIGRINQMESDL